MSDITLNRYPGNSPRDKLARILVWARGSALEMDNPADVLRAIQLTACDALLDLRRREEMPR